MHFKDWLASIGIAEVSLALAVGCSAAAAQTPSPERLGIDDHGNVWVSASNGERLLMAVDDHCLEIAEADDRQSIACLVSSGFDDDGALLPSLQLEIYRPGGRRLLLDPNGTIGEWHFWKEGQEVAISFQMQSGETKHALYDGESGRLIEQVLDPRDLRRLPQWAKTRIRMDEESVPTDPASAQERQKWIAKLMRQIATIKPGMRRQDLAVLFRADGGLTFFGGPQRFDFRECPMIKVDVRFKSSRNGQISDDEDDVIESISKPYLEYPFAD
jgi:hypothetical protein